MQLRIRAQNLDVPPEMRHAIERKLRLTLGRHASAIKVARITLLPAAPVGGNQACRCRIRVRLRQGMSLAVEDHAEDPHAAAAAAAWQLEQRLNRQRAAQPPSPSHPRRLERR